MPPELYIMKYLGGKQRLGKHIAPILKDLWEKYELVFKIKLKAYVEPFCGSLGVLRNMTGLEEGVDGEAPKPKYKIIANDYHQDLIQMWTEVQAGTFKYPKSISEEQYLAAKELPSPNALKSFVGFGMSFGGRFFGAYSQKYMNGKVEDFCKEMVNSLTRTAPLIQNVKFTNKDYAALKPNKMFVYCDPPYAVTKFPIKYRRETKKYDVFDNAKFWDVAREWSKNNLVVISETTAPDDFVNVWELERYRSAAQSSKTRFKDEDAKTHNMEKLFVHKSIADKLF
jgi:DNA adenine methylase